MNHRGHQKGAHCRSLKLAECHRHAQTVLAGGLRKTGPRTVLLNGPAWEIVERRMAKGNSPWVFPSVRDPARPRGDKLPLWYRFRREAGIGDVRLHDLRHTVASQAVLNGVPLTVVARLLGHSDVRMTMRYAHVGDREVEAAAERVGRIVADIMGIQPATRLEGGCRDVCTTLTSAR